MAAINVRSLLAQTTCPHCWHEFAPQDVLFVASHEDLRGDPRLGPDEMLRFRPSRFNPMGHAFDARNLACQDMACPRCHLPIPEVLLTAEPFFVSILGTPGCGKSFYLAALTWELRHLLPSRFALSFTDADPAANRVLNAHESSLFLREGTGKPTPLASLILKTELGGNTFFSSVSFGTQQVLLPKPFLFSLRPGPGHPAGNSPDLCRVLCLYDNPGEHFDTGADKTNQQTTRHLARAQVLIYLFDPTQDPRFRQRFRDATQRELPPGAPSRQETVLREAADRVRRLTGLAAHARHDKPLFVVLTKYDVWKPLFPVPGDEPFVTTGQQTGLDRNLMLDRSAALRKLLVQTCPEVVMAAEDFSSQVIYWPASPLGRAPVIDPATRTACLAPGPITPVGVTAPLLFGLNIAMKNLVLVKRKPSHNTPAPESSRPSKTPMPKTPGSSSGRLRPGISEDTQS